MRPGWKEWIFLVVAVLHMLAMMALYGYRPSGTAPRVFRRATAPSGEVLMVLSFPAPRQEKKHAIAESNPRRTASPIGDGMQEPGFTGALAASSAPPGESTTTALDLRLASPPDTTLPSKDFLKHTTVLDYHATRYERAWISEGNLTHVVARRSMIAGALLGALGALREPCTDADRRNYKAGCVPDQYEYKPEELDD